MGRKDEADKDFEAKLAKCTKEEMQEEMLGPTIKLQMQRYHKLHDTWRRKAVGQQEKEDQQLYAMKGKGQWNLMRSMVGKGHVKALTALRRIVKGPRGQPKGSVTTDPEEVDAIIRAAYGKIYDGNVKDQEKLRENILKSTINSFSMAPKRRQRSQVYAIKGC